MTGKALGILDLDPERKRGLSALSAGEPSVDLSGVSLNDMDIENKVIPQLDSSATTNLCLASNHRGNNLFGNNAVALLALALCPSEQQATKIVDCLSLIPKRKAPYREMAKTRRPLSLKVLNLAGCDIGRRPKSNYRLGEHNSLQALALMIESNRTLEEIDISRKPDLPETEKGIHLDDAKKLRNALRKNWRLKKLNCEYHPFLLSERGQEVFGDIQRILRRNQYFQGLLENPQFLEATDHQMPDLMPSDSDAFFEVFLQLRPEVVIKHHAKLESLIRTMGISGLRTFNQKLNQASQAGNARATLHKATIVGVGMFSHKRNHKEASKLFHSLKDRLVETRYKLGKFLQKAHKSLAAIVFQTVPSKHPLFSYAAHKEGELCEIGNTEKAVECFEVAHSRGKRGSQRSRDNSLSKVLGREFSEVGKDQKQLLFYARKYGFTHTNIVGTYSNVTVTDTGYPFAQFVMGLMFYCEANYEKAYGCFVRAKGSDVHDADYFADCALNAYFSHDKKGVFKPQTSQEREVSAEMKDALASLLKEEKERLEQLASPGNITKLSKTERTFVQGLLLLQQHKFFEAYHCFRRANDAGYKHAKRFKDLTEKAIGHVTNPRRLSNRFYVQSCELAPVPEGTSRAAYLESRGHSQRNGSFAEYPRIRRRAVSEIMTAEGPLLKAREAETAVHIVEGLEQKAKRGDDDARFRLGLAYEKGLPGLAVDLKEALGYYEQVKSSSSEYLFSRYRAAQIAKQLFNEGNEEYFQRAIDYLTEIPVSSPLYPNALHMMGQLYEKVEDEEQAFKAFLKAASQGHKTAMQDCLRISGQVFATILQTQLEKKYMADGLDAANAQEAASIQAEEKLEEMPSKNHLFWYLARDRSIRFDVAQLSKAQDLRGCEIYQDALQAVQEPDAERPARRTMGLCTLGFIAFVEEDYFQALSYFKEAAAEHLPVSKIINWTQQFLIQSLKDAEEKYGVEIKINPADLHEDFAQTKSYQDAIAFATIKFAFSIEEYARNQMTIGLLLLAVDKAEEAIPFLEKAMQKGHSKAENLLDAALNSYLAQKGAVEKIREPLEEKLKAYKEDQAIMKQQKENRTNPYSCNLFKGAHSRLLPNFAPSSSAEVNRVLANVVEQATPTHRPI